MKTIIRILALVALFAAASARADLDQIRNAAEAGNPEAQLELGILFQYGFNYKDNEVPALTWYMLSARQGNAKAAQLRDALKAKMAEKDVNEAMEQVANYKPKAAPGAEPYPTLQAPASQQTPAAAPEPAAPAEAPAAAAAPAETPAAVAPPAAEAAPIPETAPPATK